MSGARHIVGRLHHVLLATHNGASRFDWSTALAAAAAVFAALVGGLALASDRFFRTRDALSQLLARFESAGFHVWIWRMEQVTRTSGAASLQQVDIENLKSDLPATSRSGVDKLLLIERALAQDWASERAYMHEVYFFALRVHAWLVSGRRSVAHRARLLNDAFGYQLLSTLLDHRIVALRLEAPRSRPISYYPTQYGCLDHACEDLVDHLAADLLGTERTWKPPHDIQISLREKLKVTNEALESLR